jgi:hypothetical protein
VHVVVVTTIEGVEGVEGVVLIVEMTLEVVVVEDLVEEILFVVVLGLQQGPGLLVVVVVGPLGPLGVVVEEVQGVETFEVGAVEQVLGEDEQLGPPDFSPVVVVVVASINLLGVVPFRQPQLLLPNKIKQKLIKLYCNESYYRY